MTELSNTMATELRRSSPVSRQESVPAKHKPGAPQVAEESRPQETVREVNSEQLQETVREMNEKVQSLRRNLQFSIDEQSGRTVIKVIDAETHETVRQIPSEEILNVAHRLMELNEEQGVIFHGTV